MTDKEFMGQLAEAGKAAMANGYRVVTAWVGRGCLSDRLMASLAERDRVFGNVRLSLAADPANDGLVLFEEG